MNGLVGELLDHYQVVELLGEGGMGAVYRARDVTLERDVALKVMHPHIARQAEVKDRFLQEARSAAKLDHPGIVKVHYFGQVNGLLYIVMQLVSGANLRQMLEDLKKQGKWVPLDEGVHLVRQVSLALDYAHRRGVLHRDIKPQNIMIEPEPSPGLPYRPVITDLGLAKLAEGGVVTRQGSSMGTPAYMSPEQAMGKKTDARSDVYSLGILLYELSVGRVPFPAKTITEAIQYHTREDPPTPRSLRPDLPPALERIILRALEKDPSKRFPDAAALGSALSGVTYEVAEVTAASTVLGTAVSLITQYQQSLDKPRGPSILKEFDTPPDVGQDSIQVLVEGEPVRTVALTGKSITIGRQEDNDIILDDPRASRHHAQIESDGTGYRVVDLGSSNGTFLANAKLLPGVPEVWGEDQALRIGSTWLRLVHAQRPASNVILHSDGTVVDSREIRTSSGTGRVGVFMETAQLAVEPGESALVTIVVLNQGALVDHFAISLQGIPTAWVALPDPIQLMPGQQQVATLKIQLPRSPESRAGQHPLVILVASRSEPAQVARVEASLTVRAYSQFRSELHPKRIRAGGEGQVTVRNLGNAPGTFSVEWRDRAAELSFAPQQTRLRLDAGQQQETVFRAKPRRNRWFGRERVHSFSAKVQSTQEGAHTHQGELISKGRLPTWLLILFALVPLVAAAIVLNGGLGAGIEPTPVVTKRVTVVVPVTATPAPEKNGLPADNSQHLGPVSTPTPEPTTPPPEPTVPTPTDSPTPITPTATPDPGVGERLETLDWSSGWTTAELYSVDGKPYLFLLKEGNGLVHIHSMNSDGKKGPLLEEHRWSPGWSVAQFYSLNGMTYLFLYKIDNAHRTYQVNSDGTIGAMVSESGTIGYSTARFFTVGGQSYLLFAELWPDGTLADSCKVLSDGPSTDCSRAPSVPWSGGWTAFEFYTLGDRTYLFLLKESDGSVHVREVGTDGTIGPVLYDYGWSGGWTTAEFYTLGGRTYLFLLRETDGAVRIREVGLDGDIGPVLYDYDWSGGWTTAEFYRVGESTYLFLLKEGDGTVHIHRIGDH